MFLKKNFINLFNCALFFSQVNSILYIKGLFGVLVLKLPSFYFFFNKNNSFSFLFLTKFFFISFFRHFRYLYKVLFNFNFVKLRLKGLGYRIKKISSSFYRFFFNFTNFFYFHVPAGFLFSVKKKNIILLSHNLSLLKNVLSHLLLLKKLSVYRIRGLIYPRQILYLKIGKKKL